MEMSVRTAINVRQELEGVMDGWKNETGHKIACTGAAKSKNLSDAWAMSGRR